MKNYKILFITTLIILFSTNAFSQEVQYHFDIQYSENDITFLRNLFKNTKVESAFITGGSFEDEISFDRNGKILSNKKKYAYDEDESKSFSIDYLISYDYDENGDLIMIMDIHEDYTDTTQLFYDTNGNAIRNKNSECEIEYVFNEENKLISSVIIDQVVEVYPIESVKYEDDAVMEIKYKCWDEGSYAPFVYLKTKYKYDDMQRVDEIMKIFGNCKTNEEKISSTTNIEYDDMNLPVKYISNDMISGEQSTTIVTYKFFK